MTIFNDYFGAKKICFNDLINREEVQLDNKKLAQGIKNAKILISGAGGSIGSEIARQIIKFHPRELILLGHGENSIYQVQKTIANCSTKITPVIADIQDTKNIHKVLNDLKPDFVYHAAAHKHVPLMESNPYSAINNNVLGTYNTATAAVDAGVKHFVMISSDKAVNPPNVMGASKRLAELLVTNLNEHSDTNFAVVRFGNVLGSRGSVVPLFQEQIEQDAPITITDFRMERYFMTIPEASRLVIQAGSLSNGGELFVLDMGKPVKILDIAKKLIQLAGKDVDKYPIVETGIRPGEKLTETLLVRDEIAQNQIYEKIFLGKIIRVKTEVIISFARYLLTLDPVSLKNEIIKFACEHNGEQVEHSMNATVV